MYQKLSCIIIAAAVAIASCGGSGGSGENGGSGGSGGNGGGSGSGSTGKLIINISNVSERLILPGEEMVPAVYIITGKGPGNAVFSRTIAGENSVEIDHLVFGDWYIHVEALNENNVSIGDGEETVTIHTGQTALCNITVAPFSGMGILDLTITWEGNLQNPYLEITMTRKGYDPFELSYELNQILGRAEILTEIEAGYYALQIELYDDTDGVSPHIGGTADVVRIISGRTTSHTIAIGTGPSNGGNGDIDDIDNPGFPSPGAPVGSDAISASTNQSGKEAETSPGLNPLAGSAFVQAPQIGNYGSASLRYAIDVPAGRAGMQPAVGLSYSSSGGDGLLGIGWSMSTGLGVITRTTRYGELYYDCRDVFAYNGKRLVKISGPENSENGIYRQEIESGFSRFEMENAENGGIWRVYDKSGTVTIFGEDRTSRVVRPDNINKTYIWNFSRSCDLNGNFMTAVYDNSEYAENHILYLKEIRYTGNYNNSTRPRQYVRFTYKDRNDYYVSKAAGFIMKMTRLLDTIDVGWDDPRGTSWSGKEASLWKYQMVYETSDDSGRPLLKTVNSSRNTTKPEFIYQGAEHTFTWKLVNDPDYNQYADPSKIKYFEGDFNGDGISDMVFFNPDTGLWKAVEGRRDGGYNFPIYGSGFRGYDNEQEIQFFKGNVTGDYNGDGRSDIAFYLPETRDFIIAEHNGKTFEFRNYGRFAVSNLDIFKCEWFTGDYDGNGLSDAVLFDETTGDWWLMRSMGGSYKFEKFSKHFQNLFREDYDPDMNMDSIYTTDTSKHGIHRGSVYFLSGDYNGDGRTDISIYDSRDGRWWVGTPETPSTAKRGHSPLAGGETSAIQIDWKLYKVFTAPEQALFSNDRFSGDFNGDGFSDFLLFDRNTGEWTLGETHDGTFDFKTISRVPQFKEITRWLQGDFNGDGRTDIGFYSKTDNNFWIGEATPDGFRYRIYNNLAYGPDPAQVLRTPMPKDGVVIQTGNSVVPGISKTSLIEYKYDGNFYEGKGEKTFLGNFGQSTGMLFYRRNKSNDLYAGWYYKDANNLIPLNNNQNFKFNPEDPSTKVLNRGMAFEYSQGNHGLLYYTKTSSNHLFNLIIRDNNTWSSKTIGNFPVQENFSPDSSLYLVGDFNNSGMKDSVMMLADDEANPQFLLYADDTNIPMDISYADDIIPGQEIPYSNSPETFRVFDNYQAVKSRVFFFSGNFDIEGIEGKILFVDTRGNNPVWYLGEVKQDEDRITFHRLVSASPFHYSGYTGIYRSFGNSIVYASDNGGSLRFNEVYENNGLKSTSFNPLNTGLVFKGEFDYLGNPVLNSRTEYKYFNLANGRLEDLVSGSGGVEKLTLERNDLIDNYYPFQWIQGDYNGDGKTDIGIFNLAETRWYFANTTGTVPDLISEVENGIGGKYIMSYINSTSLDNTGDDGIEHLPMNYKVCDKLTIEDGQGNRVVTRYEYKKGYAFSAFINRFKETDYFGFGEFRIIDALGGRTISEYNNIPYQDFRMNRALAGAIKRSRFIGYDNIEYNRTEYDYRIHKIETDDAPVGPLNPPEGDLMVTSYLVESAEVREYKRNVLTETKKSLIVLLPNKYEMMNKTESATDHYSDSANLETTITAFSEFENISSTNEMRLVRKKDFTGSPNEITADYDYDSRGNLTGKELRYTGSGLDSADDRVFTYMYDEYGNRVRETDRSASPYRITERSFEDEAGLFQYITEEKDWTGAIYLSTKYALNYEAAFGSITEKTDPNGNSTYFDYDDYGRLFRQRADTSWGDKRVLSEYFYSANLPSPLYAKVIQYTGTTDPSIETAAFSDGMGRTIHTVRSAGPNSSGHKYTKTGMLVYDVLGRLARKSQTAWAGNDEINKFVKKSNEKYPTKYEYDGSGRQAKVTQPAGYAGEPETSIAYTYNDPWMVVSEHSVGRAKKTISNARGLVLYVNDSGLGDDNQEIGSAIGFAYDAAGNRVKKMDLGGFPLNPPEGDLSGLDFGMDNNVDTSLFQAGVKDQSGNNVCQWKYDGFGRVTGSSDADMGYTGYEYNAFGDLTSSTDSLGRETEFIYDRLGRIAQKHLPGTEGNVIYTYDANTSSENSLGRLVKLDDPSQVKIFSYDKMGRIDKEIRTIKTPSAAKRGHSPLAGGATRASKGVGDVTFVTYFEYDLLNRKYTINYPADPNTGARLMAKYSFSSMGATSVDIYNSKGRKEIISSILYNEFGQMSEILRGNGTETYYTYDIKGRLSQLVTYTNSNNQTRKLQDVSYTFKVDNSILSTTNTPDIDTAGGYLSTVKYDYQYDGLNRLIKSEGLFTKGSIPNSQNQDVIRRFEESYAYSANGNMTGKTIFDPQSHAIQDQLAYSYDEDNHAVTGISSVITGEEKFTMQYDAVGNMISQISYQTPSTAKRGHSPLAGGATNAEKFEEQQRLSPLLRGELKGGFTGGATIASKAMSYDSYNRIIRVTNPDAGNETVGQYWYDDQGFRVRKLAKRRISGEDRQVEVLYPSMYFGVERHKTLQGANIPNTTYSVNNIYLDGVRIAAVIPSGDARYYLTDQVDSVKVVADDNGRAVTRMEYMPYGDTWFEEGDTNNAPKYNSQELDQESNFYYYNARHYSQEISRFVTADTVIDGEFDTQGWNRYAYCKGNPIRYKDPTGHAVVENNGTSILSSIVDFFSGFFSGEEGSGESTKTSIENSITKAKGSGENKTSSGTPGKDPDVTVISVIVGNLKDKDGNIVGMYGKQYMKYKDKDGKELIHTVEDVQWKEDKKVEKGQKFPYENPAEPGEFNIYKRPKEAENKSDYKIWTDHPEGGIRAHPKGRSEGCVLFDRKNPVGKKSYDELEYRTYQKDEQLKGSIKSVIDMRTNSDRNAAPVPYEKNENYIIIPRRGK